MLFLQVSLWFSSWYTSSHKHLIRKLEEFSQVEEKDSIFPIPNPDTEPQQLTEKTVRSVTFEQRSLRTQHASRAWKSRIWKLSLRLIKNRLGVVACKKNTVQTTQTWEGRMRKRHDNGNCRKKTPSQNSTHVFNEIEVVKWTPITVYSTLGRLLVETDASGFFVLLLGMFVWLGNPRRNTENMEAHINYSTFFCVWWAYRII